MRKCQWGESALDTALGHLQAAGAGQLVTVIQLRTLPFLSDRGRNQQSARQRGNILGQNNKHPMLVPATNSPPGAPGLHSHCFGYSVNEKMFKYLLSALEYRNI